MSMVYHSYDSNHAAVNELVAGAYAEHVGTLGFDEELSTLSRNAVENRVIAARILEDEDKYLLKTEAASTYSTKAYVQGLFPVGTIYMNDQSSSVPFDFGTWELIDGKFLYGCNSSFSDLRGTGGNTSVTLSTSHLPAGNIPISFPAISGSTGSTSTAHTHSISIDSTSNNSCAFTFGFGSTAVWRAQALSGSCSAYKTIGSYTTTGNSIVGLNDAISINFNHSHGASIGGMSANESHSHSFSIPAQSLNIQLNSGTQSSFSTVPPYYKVAIWHRVS